MVEPVHVLTQCLRLTSRESRHLRISRCSARCRDDRRLYRRLSTDSLTTTQCLDGVHLYPCMTWLINQHVNDLIR